jgi:hypothetical protein
MESPTSCTAAVDSDVVLAGDDVLQMLPAVEQYLTADLALRRAKTSWKQLDRCFRWELVQAYLQENAAVLEQQLLGPQDGGGRGRGVDLVARLRQLLLRNELVTQIEFDPVAHRVTKIDVDAVLNGGG